MTGGGRSVLWWGRFDPGYSRNRILRQAYTQLGWRVADFHPVVSAIGDLEAMLRRPPRADLVHVPCFRHRDLHAAARHAQRHGIPLLFDPLISAYDKQVHERGKLPPGGTRARRLLHREQEQMARPDLVLTDTTEHARFFADPLRVPETKLRVVYVGAEDPLFVPGPARRPNDPIEVLFYGSFIPLQGPEVIVEAARRYRGPAVRWVMLGDGPLRRRCRDLAVNLPDVHFEDWSRYTELPARIARADILLGIFGDTAKTQRVIPNKAFQSLACGKPLVTCAAPAYPCTLSDDPDSGIRWVPAGDAQSLAEAVAALASRPEELPALGARGRASYEKYFSGTIVVNQLRAALASLFG